MNIYDIYKIFKRHPEVTTDSRSCPVNSIFFALKGENFNGNAFAENALQSGCAYAVIDDDSFLAPDLKNDQRIIKVENVLGTLQQLAALHRKSMHVKVIAVTGTNGKTTTKELIAAILSKKYNTLYTKGNLNNHIGVPLTILQLTDAHEFAVIEMGASHTGEIRALSKIAQPEYGIITNVGLAHLEGFGTLRGIMKAKSELYDYLRRANGLIFLDYDNEKLMQKAEGMRKVMYGELIPGYHTKHYFYEEKPFVEGEKMRSSRYFCFMWRLQGENFNTVETRLVGDYNLQNALAAISVGLYFNVEPEQINEALSNFEPSNNRSQWKHTEFNEVIIDAYNANPTSMIAALRNFKNLKAEPKALILGDMLELGEKSRQLHSQILRELNRRRYTKTFLCGKIFSEISTKKYQCFADVNELITHFGNNPLKGYHILIKGSHGMHLEKIIDKL